MEILQTNTADYPFAQLYFFQHGFSRSSSSSSSNSDSKNSSSKNFLILKNGYGLPTTEENLIHQESVRINDRGFNALAQPFYGALSRVATSGESEEVDITNLHLPPCGKWNQSPTSCYITPIFTSSKEILGVLVIGINTMG